MYYKNANAFCLVYDSTNKATFDALTYWTEQIAEKMDTKYSLFIVASKIDLNQSEEVSITEASTFCKLNSAVLNQTSSKDGTGVNALF